MIKVKKGQDPYTVIGQYIIDHVSVIEDIIAVIEIDGKTSNELFMVDMTVDGFFIWKSDWYEGGNVTLIDFFPVSDACNPTSAQQEIIRCKDCMHNGSFDTDCPIDWNGKEYCSFAEREEDE